MNRKEKRKLRHKLYSEETDGLDGHISTREAARYFLGREPTLDEVREYAYSLRDMVQKGHMLQVVNKEEKNRGKKNVYGLTDYGRRKCRLEIKNDYHCPNCDDILEEEEIIRRPTCSKCGTPIHYKKR